MCTTKLLTDNKQKAMHFNAETYTDKALQRHTNTNIQIYDKLSYFTNSHRGLNFKHR